MQAAQEALEHIGGGNAVFPGIHQANLIGYIIGQLFAVLNADDIAVGVRHSRVDGIDQLLCLAGAFQAHNNMNHRKVLLCLPAYWLMHILPAIALICNY